ncbi:nuclease [Elizabethkingia phage TCUEAP1]|nr:nuclease [Elizabethkingia phage TCUEAP1]
MNHANRSHAVLSASSSSRWMNCTGSVILSKDIPDVKSSYAAEGELAHEIAENSIKYQLGMKSKYAHDKALKGFKAHVEYYEGMIKHVSPYIEFVLEEINKAKLSDFFDYAMEVKVDYSKYAPDGKGTLDQSILANEFLTIIDLKFGKGVKVEAEGNSQTRLYALGAVEYYESMGLNVESVRMVIVQPRMDNITEETILVSDLKEWGQNEVLPKAVEAMSGNGVLKMGEWCTFCKACPQCPKANEEALKIVNQDFPKWELLTKEEQLDTYEKAPYIIKHLNLLVESIKERAYKGEEFEGYKLIEGSSQRKIINQEEAINILIRAGYTEKELITSEIKGFGALEELVGKKQLAELLGDLIHKPKGGPKLVTSDNPKPVYRWNNDAEDLAAFDEYQEFNIGLDV